MEVLGITASVISIGGAVDQCLSLISQIRRHFAASDEIRALQDDPVRLALIVSRLKSIIDRTFLKHGRDVETMQLLVQSYNNITIELAELLESCQKWQKKDGKRPLEKHLMALSWAKKRTRITLVQQQLRDVMTGCSLYLGLMQIDGPVNGNEREFNELAAMEKSIGGLSALSLSPDEPTLDQPRAQDLLPDQLYEPNNTITLAERYEAHTSVENTTKHREEAVLQQNSNQLGASFCGCYCHSTFLWQLRLVERWLGSLFFSTIGTAECHQCVCQSGQRTAVTYYCPRWLALKGLFLSITQGERMQLSLSLPRMVAPDSPFFRCIRRGDCLGVKQLLADGKASIADISAPYGYSALTTALVHNQAEMSRFLLSQGAPQIVSEGSWTMDIPTFFNHYLSCSLIDFDVSASDTMSEYMMFLRAGWHRNTLQDYQKLNMLESLRLPRLHKAIMGISSEKVSVAAAACMDMINELDLFGRTALYWAASLKDEFAIRTLLFHGADSTKADQIGISPINISAATGVVGCIQAFIDVGADTGLRDRFGATPLHYAVANGSILALKLLLNHGHDSDVQTYLGEPLIFYVNHSWQTDIAGALVGYGASMTLTDNWGYDAILDAVFANAHGVLSVCLEGGLNSDTRIIDGKTILHVAALNSGLRTVELLLGFNFYGIDPQARDHAGHTALEYVRCKRNNEDVFEPFCSLIFKAESDNRNGGMILDK